MFRISLRGLPPWWDPIVYDLYTGFTLSWGSTKCMLILRRNPYTYDEVSVGNEDSHTSYHREAILEPLHALSMVGMT